MWLSFGLPMPVRAASSASVTDRRVLEGLADGAFVFASTVIPGLLQTEEYAQALTGPTLVFPAHQWSAFIAAAAAGTVAPRARLLILHAGGPLEERASKIVQATSGK